MLFEPEGLRGIVRRARWTLVDEWRGVRVRLLLINWVQRLLPHSAGVRLRRLVLRAGGVHVGRETVVLGSVSIGGAGTLANLTIGQRCTVNRGVFFDPADRLSIGDDVGIGHDVLLITSSHEVGGPGRRHGPVTTAPITIGNGAWLCARSMIQPGVVVGEGAVVLAGAVVAASVDAHAVVGGVPATVVARLPS